MKSYSNQDFTFHYSTKDEFFKQYVMEIPNNAELEEITDKEMEMYKMYKNSFKKKYSAAKSRELLTKGAKNCRRILRKNLKNKRAYDQEILVECQSKWNDIVQIEKLVLVDLLHDVYFNGFTLNI
jgi:hydroxymethylpyrimidine/phosphomethylpyrimidine kinase